MQVLDLAIFDEGYHLHEFRHLAISSIIIVLGLTLQIFTR